jgi:ArsR family transcriptional regulator, arsenate/arsenite/antimonite-responsive transcriptional repressor
METTHPTDAPAFEQPSPEVAAQAFAALGSEPRLEVVRRLVRAGPDGMAVGALQEALGMAASTLSHHLRFLAAAGLLTQERRGRSLICRASFANIDALADFLRRECCLDAAPGHAHAHDDEECLLPENRREAAR